MSLLGGPRLSANRPEQTNLDERLACSIALREKRLVSSPSLRSSARRGLRTATHQSPIYPDRGREIPLPMRRRASGLGLWRTRHVYLPAPATAPCLTPIPP